MHSDVQKRAAAAVSRRYGRQGDKRGDVRPVRVLCPAKARRPAQDRLQDRARKSVLPRPVPFARAEHGTEDPRNAAAHTGDDAQHGGTLLRPRRNLGRQIRVLRKLHEDRAAGFPADGQQRARLHQLGLPDRRAPYRAGHGRDPGEKGASLVAAAPCLRNLSPSRITMTAMPRIDRASLMTLEAYARERPQFRAKVMAHKKNRTVQLGDHITLVFEDELTIRYQVQEMLRVERIFEEAGIQEELDAYNPLVPDGRNLKATMMLEYPDPEERSRRLGELIGIEDKVWIQIEGYERGWAVADEDLERENEAKTSSVHFLSFEFTEPMVQALKKGAGLAIGVDHPRYKAAVEAPPAVREGLARDQIG